MLDGINLTKRPSRCWSPRRRQMFYSQQLHREEINDARRGVVHFRQGLHRCQSGWRDQMGMEQMAKKHPGFKAVASKIAAKEGVSKERANAILAASSRGASAAAKRKNPRLKKV